MNYTVGKPGRVIVARLQHGEPIYATIEALAARERVRHAAVWIVGGLMHAGVVVGPQADDERPPRIRVERFDDAREILGLGTLFLNESGQPKLHLHATMGKGRTVLTGCPRAGADCWLVDEVVILEISGAQAERRKDAASGFELLACGPEKPTAGPAPGNDP